MDNKSNHTRYKIYNNNRSDYFIIKDFEYGKKCINNHDELLSILKEICSFDKICFDKEETYTRAINLLSKIEKE